ncbi:MAG TPA: aldose epimerase family protein [Ohtaekwangia sp.]
MKYVFPLMALVVLMSACKKEQKETTVEPPALENTVTSSVFGTLADGKEVKLYTLKNKNGVEMSVINYGGIIVSLKAPDKQGNFADVVLGYDSLSQYVKSNPFFGALIGRYGNRIAKGKFSLDGKTYTLAANNGVNHLHGGPKGYDKVFWNIEVLPDSSSLKLTYASADGEEGYPGNLNAEVVYTLNDSNELRIDYKATTDKKTIVNLTQHTYFNLSGNGVNDILSHQLMMASDKFLPVDKTLIPTGELKAVAGSPFDFNTLTTIGTRINDKNEQLAFGGGYDHCWVLNNYTKGSVRKVAELYEPQSGRVVEVSTDEPGLQFYSGNFLDGTLTGKGGTVYKYRTGLCLETQHYPDSPNQPAFPSVVLNPGETYQTTTIYKFSAR